jgi:hypothetical protein
MKDEWQVEPIEGVSITYTWRSFEVELAWPTGGRRGEVNTLVRARRKGADNPGLVRSRVRINLYSSSALDSLITALRRQAGDDKDDIAGFVHALADDAVEWYRRGAATTLVEPRLTNGGNWLVYPVWPATGTTAIAAAPGAYKSLLAQGIALQLATGHEILASNTRTPRKVLPVLYLDWEADEATFASRLWALCEGAGLEQKPYLAYKTMRVPLQDAAVSIAEEIARGRFGAVVIDSMSASIGGGLIDDDVVNGFWDAIRILGIPALVLAHKSAENIKKREARFFGSIMSEARIRYAWNGEATRNGDTVVWSVFKDNNMGHLRTKLAWRVEITQEGDNEDRHMTEVHLAGISPHDIHQPPDEPNTTVDRIEQALLEGAMMAGEIATATGANPGTIRKVISRHGDRFVKTSDGRWALAQSPLEQERPDPY